MLRIRRFVGSGWIVTAILASFLGLLTQPQTAALYHVHAGGEHVHVHARLLIAPTAAREHTHPHSHPHRHHHTAHARVRHAGHHGASAQHRKTAVLRHVHTSHKGHWHTVLALHLAALPPTTPLLTSLHSAPFSQTVIDSYIFAAFRTYRSRAPPALG
ncbi:MAG TPA: hypothetical protein VNN62_17755 [Methylomirabilota bacterium]|nr:hypothetical protein [Methylomirabilota bacterium]